MNYSDNVLTSQCDNSNIKIRDEVQIMTTTLQIRIDDELKQQATKVYEELGMDLSTAVRIFLKRSVYVNGMPFELVNGTTGEKALWAMRNMQETSRLNGNDEMSLDEINKEIAKARKTIKARTRGK